MQVLLAYLIDLLVGDPNWLIHPVVVIGKGITWLEKVLRRWLAPLLGLRVAGLALAISIVGSTYLVTWTIMILLTAIHPVLAWLGGIWLISTAVAAKGLAKAGLEIVELLKYGKLGEARQKVGWIVGRDTDNLDEGEIARATVETVAENIVDGVIAPLFFALLGGAPLAMAYRAVNTLDSMVGYKNEKYLEFGWASARLDDLANLIPARITGVLLIGAAWMCRLNARNAWIIMLRDAVKHPSPNSGYPEAAVAGALGVRLGGLNYYGGQESFRAYLGDPSQALEGSHISLVIRLMYVSVAIFVVFGLVDWIIFSDWRWWQWIWQE